MSTHVNKCSLSDYPVKFNNHDKAISQKQARQNLNLSPNKKTVMILGGSQGSLFLNQTIKKLIGINPRLSKSIQIIHQTGSLDQANLQKFYEQQAIQAIVFSYDKEMINYYVSADLVICRAGAGTLAEVTFFEKKCITIPLETKATSHQVDNAYAIAKRYPNLVKVIKQQEIARKSALLFNLLTQK